MKKLVYKTICNVVKCDKFVVTASSVLCSLVGVISGFYLLMNVNWSNIVLLNIIWAGLICWGIIAYIIAVGYICRKLCSILFCWFEKYLSSNKHLFSIC